MESLNDTTWDVVIAGTGLQESLLALALSRSGKRILHIDRNAYYGGNEASFSLQEANAWVNGAQGVRNFSNASITLPSPTEAYPGASTSQLAASRSYNISLAPHLIYTRSRLLQILVSTRVDQQLEFLAAGNWWVVDDEVSTRLKNDYTGAGASVGSLLKVPQNREDIFTDQKFDMRMKRSLMKALRSLSSSEIHSARFGDQGVTPVVEFLSSEFGLSGQTRKALLALSLSSKPASETSSSYAVPRIATYLHSMNALGPGFGTVIPKWGGLAEIAQVSCRAGAVGGGVYSLKNGVTSISAPEAKSASSQQMITINLENGDKIRSIHLVASPHGLMIETSFEEPVHASSISRSVSIISSPLTSVFPPPSEGIPASAVAIISMDTGDFEEDVPKIPVYLMVHSSDTGECPAGQSIIYGSVMLPSNRGHPVLNRAVYRLLALQEEIPHPSVLWTLQYEQSAFLSDKIDETSVSEGFNDHVSVLEPLPIDLVFDDSVLDSVEAVWRKILGPDATKFMQFEHRDVDDHDDAYYM